MPKVHFTTKARVLEALEGLIEGARIEPQFRFTVADWTQDPDAITRSIGIHFSSSVIVRSSALREDAAESSQAGAFFSAHEVNPLDAALLSTAICKVIASFDDGNSLNEVFVQRYLSNTTMSGVLFTRDLDTLSPYFIIEYDDHSARTDTVTSGSTNEIKTRILFREHTSSDPIFRRLISVARSVEKLVGSDCLDIEFAIDNQDEIVLLQVRPLATASHTTHVQEAELASYLRKIHKKIRKLGRRHPPLDGEEPYFGVMPDWNPAEIIGIRPRTLALSLYKELVTDSIWAHQRYNYGYRDLRSFPLLVSFLGIPYIDIRASANSFVPRQLPRSISSKLVQYYLDKLKTHPHLHDKVEFDVIFSCFFPTLADRLGELRDHGFNANQLKRIEFTLLALTNDIITPEEGFCELDIKQIDVLDERYRMVTGSDAPTIDRIYWLIEDCKRYGTLPFAGIARSAFIAMQLLRSLVDGGLVTPDEHDAFLTSFSTISKLLQRDLAAVRAGTLSKAAFKEEYGHLRPGTYDILSPRYDEGFDFYFSDRKAPSPTVEPEQDPFQFSEQTLLGVDRMMVECGLTVSAPQLFSYIRRAVEGREYAKFVFSRNLSEVLRLVEKLGAKCEIDREALSFLNIRTVVELYASLDHRDLVDILRTDIAKNRTYYRYTQLISLPHVIFSPDDIYEFDRPAGRPNYITRRRVVANITSGADNANDITGRIVFIPSADPGYDWVFSREPAGLVTMYGGSNSHMAIRCAELSLPAVIGAGEANFNRWSKGRRVEIDCENHVVRIIE